MRGADVVLCEHVEHAGARDPGDQRGKHHAQRGAWQNHMRQERPEAGGNADIALHRQQVGPDRKDKDQHISEHEDRHREAEHREHHDDSVDPRAGLPGRQDSHRDRRQNRDDQRRDRQRHGRFEALLDEFRDRQVGEDRNAEIALQEAPHPAAELDVDGLVEAELGADADDVFDRRGIAGDDRGGIARAQIQKREDKDCDDRHDRDRRQDAPDDIGEHQPETLPASSAPTRSPLRGDLPSPASGGGFLREARR